MQDFERMACFTMIDSIEHQLRGLKALLAAGGNMGKGGTHTVHRQAPGESQYVSEDDEARIAEMYEKVRVDETKKMAERAAVAHSALWSETAAEPSQ